METLVVNIFGVPGAGKSTGAARVFSDLKMRGINVELVSEFAKDKVWEGNEEAFRNQAFLFGKQSYRMSRCAGKVDVIVTDSPLPLSILYNNDARLTENFNKSVMDVFNSYWNLNFLLTRTKPYNPSGRLQTEEESDALGEPLIQMLGDRGVAYTVTTGDAEGYDIIVREVLNALEGDGEKPAPEISAADALWLRGAVCLGRGCSQCPIYWQQRHHDARTCTEYLSLYPEEALEHLVRFGIGNGYLKRDGNRVIKA